MNIQKIKYFTIALLFPLFLFPVGKGAKIVAANKKDYLITKFGAVAGGNTLNTLAIQAAIDAAHKNKGGKVIIPKGKFLSGSIVLKTGVDLCVSEDATLLGSTNPVHYSKYKGHHAFVIADGASDFSISGKGTIDGQGRELALTLDSLHHSGELIDSNYNYRRMRPGNRPELLNFTECVNVQVKGITIRNSSAWVQTFDRCTNLEIDNINVESRAFWNNDGIDVVDCKNVRITNCNVDAADDGICLKSHSSEQCNDQIYIANCTVRSSANAVKFGTGSYGGFKNVTIENIKVYDTFRSAIAIESVDGAVIENIKVSNITAVNTGNAIFIRLGHRKGEKPGILKNVSIKNVKAQIPFGRPDIDYDLRGPEVDFFHNPFPCSIAGIPGHKIENVVLENIEITYPGRASKGMAYVPLSRLKQVPENIDGYPEFSMFRELPAYGLYVRHAKGISLKNVHFKLEREDFRPAFVFDDVEGLQMEEVDVPATKKYQIILKDVTEGKFDEKASALKKEF